MSDYQDRGGWKKQPGQNSAVVAHTAGLSKVGEAIQNALITNNQNQFAMTFETIGKDGKKIISPYVKKAGMSWKMNEAAKKKGGVVYQGHRMIRSQFESRDDILAVFTALPESEKNRFLEARNNDFSCLTLPDGTAKCYYCIIFKNGEKWDGTATATVENVPAKSFHFRLDEMAKTRAFRQTLAYGLGDGFLPEEMICGIEDWEMAEAELAAEEAAEMEEAITTTGKVVNPGDDRFRPISFDLEGMGDGTECAEESRGVEESYSQAEESSEARGKQSPPRYADGESNDGAGSRSNGEYVPEINDLMAAARKQRILLIDLVRHELGVDSLSRLTPEERIHVWKLLHDNSQKEE